MVDHLSKTMGNRKTKSMDPVFGYAPCSQNGGGGVVGHNKVITRATVPDRIYGNRISHYRDLRKSPGFADRQNLVNDIAIQWIRRNNGVGFKLAKQFGHGAFEPGQHRHVRFHELRSINHIVDLPPNPRGTIDGCDVGAPQELVQPAVTAIEQVDDLYSDLIAGHHFQSISNISSCRVMAFAESSSEDQNLLHASQKKEVRTGLCFGSGNCSDIIMGR